MSYNNKVHNLLVALYTIGILTYDQTDYLLDTVFDSYLVSYP